MIHFLAWFLIGAWVGAVSALAILAICRAAARRMPGPTDREWCDPDFSPRSPGANGTDPSMPRTGAGETKI